MLKKLQNLLFEDEEEVEEEEEEEYVAPAPRKRTAPKPAVEETVEVPQPKAETTMTRIDVTQPIPTQTVDTKASNGSVFTAPQQKASPRPLDDAVKSEPVKTTSGLGITVDEVKAPVVEEPKKPVVRPTAAPKNSGKKPSVKGSSIYEFKPVISPMFGVDEKDMNAMQISSATQKSSYLDDVNNSNIISPIYGVNKEARPTNIQTTVQKSNELENLSYTKEAQMAEDSIPSFSLDDILNSRDDSFAQSTVSREVKPEPVDIDETVVFDSSNITPFGHVNIPDEKKN